MSEGWGISVHLLCMNFVSSSSFVVAYLYGLGREWGGWGVGMVTVGIDRCIIEATVIFARSSKHYDKVARSGSRFDSCSTNLYQLIT